MRCVCPVCRVGGSHDWLMWGLLGAVTLAWAYGLYVVAQAVGKPVLVGVGAVVLVSVTVGVVSAVKASFGTSSYVANPQAAARSRGAMLAPDLPGRGGLWSARRAPFQRLRANPSPALPADELAVRRARRRAA